jgi:hypothetical protein
MKYLFLIVLPLCGCKALSDGVNTLTSPGLTEDVSVVAQGLEGLEAQVEAAKGFTGGGKAGDALAALVGLFAAYKATAAGINKQRDERRKARSEPV